MLFGNDCTFSDFEKRFICTLNNKTRISNFFDLTDNAAVCNDFLVDLKLLDHLFCFLLFPLLRQDYKKVKNRKNRDKWQ